MTLAYLEAVNAMASVAQGERKKFYNHENHISKNTLKDKKRKRKAIKKSKKRNR